MHPTPILATFSNISGRPKDMQNVGFLMTRLKLFLSCSVVALCLLLHDV